MTFFDLNLIIRNFHIVVKALYKVFSAVFTIIFGLFYKKICEFFAYSLSVDFFVLFQYGQNIFRKILRNVYPRYLFKREKVCVGVDFAHGNAAVFVQKVDAAVVKVQYFCDFLGKNLYFVRCVRFSSFAACSDVTSEIDVRKPFHRADVLLPDDDNS